jgi:hypothetical protein
MCRLPHDGQNRIIGTGSRASASSRQCLVDHRALARGIEQADAALAQGPGDALGVGDLQAEVGEEACELRRQLLSDEGLGHRHAGVP